jgi:hypothetical protein
LVARFPAGHQWLGDFSLKGYLSMLWKEKIFCEKLPFQVDTEKLREFFLLNIIETLPAVWQGTYDPVKNLPMTTAMLSDESVVKTWGGWSLQSFDGNYTSAWVPGHWKFAGNNYQRYAVPEISGIKHTKPTQICKGPFLELLHQLSGMGFHPHKARIACVPRQTSLKWHIRRQTAARNDSTRSSKTSSTRWPLERLTSRRSIKCRPNK